MVKSQTLTQRSDAITQTVRAPVNTEGQRVKKEEDQFGGGWKKEGQNLVQELMKSQYFRANC